LIDKEFDYLWHISQYLDRSECNCNCNSSRIDPSECVRNCVSARERCVEEAIARCGRTPACIEPCFAEQTACIARCRPGAGR